MLILAPWMTLRHFGISLRMSAAKPSGVVGVTRGC